MTKHTIYLEVSKDKTDIFLKVKISRDIESFFQELSLKEYGEGENLQQSEKWLDASSNGLQFYRSSDELNSSLDKYLNGRLSGNNGRTLGICNNFGSGLYNTDNYNELNIAILRAVGASEGITIKTTDLLSYEEIKDYVENLAVVVKEFYKNYLQKAKIKAKISFEI